MLKKHEILVSLGHKPDKMVVAMLRGTKANRKAMFLARNEARVEYCDLIIECIYHVLGYRAAAAYQLLNGETDDD